MNGGFLSIRAGGNSPCLLTMDARQGLYILQIQPAL